ncbi:CCXG family PEP-CTERM protein [Alteromonas facilis]|uniref:CCXG family PEP-CTERM protein n=1 Tax=Alteromonas facilis TaxID=2048004 RepID=UPI000C2943FD|nr:CCXG family PEP-CTERM protein [Alteromonas facilis]
MFKKFFAVFSLIVATSFSAQASLITVEHADVNVGTFNADLAAIWAGLSAGDITSDSIDTATLLYNGSANNQTIFKMTITVPNTRDILFNLFAGLDAGFGAEVFVNGSLLTEREEDLWWGRSWSNGDVMSIEGLNFLVGSNEIVVYWAEGSNSGGNSFEFSVDGGDRLVLSTSNLYTAVPTPSTLALFGLVLFGLGMSRRKL